MSSKDLLPKSLFKNPGILQIEGVEKIVAHFKKIQVTDKRWISYALASVYHESARTMQPLREYGKGKRKPYGMKDAETGQTYYGRGLVQITWKENYERFSKILKTDLVNFPNLTLEWEVALPIMSIGMIKGMFTGKKLIDYFNSEKTDFYNARRIINGTDKAAEIAGYAGEFMKVV